MTSWTALGMLLAQPPSQEVQETATHMPKPEPSLHYANHGH